MWALISTWSMAEEGVAEGAKFLDSVSDAAMCVEKVIVNVENKPEYESVGFGGWPNEKGEVEMDSAFMDGNTLNYGAVTALKGVANPIKVSRSLSVRRTNCFLTGEGAYEYAAENGFELKNMLSEDMKAKYQERKRKESADEKSHDTVCALCIDHDGTIAAGSSTSGLMMKKRGRVGDSALIGSGIYADSDIGAAAATGLGEDIMKGCLSFEIVKAMENGKTPLEACEETLRKHRDRLKRSIEGELPMSVIALDKEGNFGAATVDQEFTFVTASSKDQKIRVMVCRSIDSPGDHLVEDIERTRSYLDDNQTFRTMK